MPSFITALVGVYTGSGLSSVQTVCAFYVIYAYCIYTKKSLWHVLIVHGITGLLGTLVENSFIAKTISNPEENWGLLLGLNEINWILHESTTVLYSMLKLETIVTNSRHKLYLRIFMTMCFVAFAACRMNIGYHRVQDDTTGNFVIAKAHSYAFIVWGTADLVLFGLLIANTLKQMKANASKGFILVLFKSSIPRFLFLIMNTFIIVVLGQLATLNEGQANLNSLVWTFKGSYPLVLLFDVITTRDMLIQSVESLSSVQTVCAFYVIYAYCLYTRKPLWHVLIVHGVCGLLGTFIENCFIAKTISNPGENWGILLGINEINWILHESTTVLYSLLKLETILSNKTHKLILRAFMGACFIAFSACRMNIGYHRVQDDTTGNYVIAQAHSYAFIVWGTADLVLFALLIANTIKQCKTNATKGMIIVLFTSSLPRFLFLIINTFIIVVLGQISSLNEGQANLNSLVWTFKGSYPLVLLFDLITTRDMLIQKAETKGGSTTEKKSHVSSMK
ncbi:hypothetical protein HDV06_002207 [Boothiomyces sp. JEL0866]|nr:hypothetical protein HDV06_002207 [Boothiomyces sp. JEL0866]